MIIRALDLLKAFIKLYLHGMSIRYSVLSRVNTSIAEQAHPTTALSDYGQGTGVYAARCVVRDTF